jgi:hypothetical protein
MSDSLDSIVATKSDLGEIIRDAVGKGQLPPRGARRDADGC